MGFTNGITTGAFFREGTTGTMRGLASVGSFASACSYVKHVCASIPYEQVFIKREAALDDSHWENAPLSRCHPERLLHCQKPASMEWVPMGMSSRALAEWSNDYTNGMGFAN
jgi:hypothetical protein